MAERHVLDAIEPEALSDTAMMKRWNPDVIDTQMFRVQLSQAISLKRIADALSGTGLDDLITGLHGPLPNLAWEAGRSFAAGQRTDR
jgi:hypothetical protein